MTKDNLFNESVWLYENSYGSAFKISRSKIILGLVIFCIITPFTNWMIPALPKLIKKGVTLRYE
jgi:hypothetical protein